MSDAMECPGCGSYTSTVLERYENGSDCKYCGLPAAVTAQVLEAAKRGADEQLTERFAQAERRAAEAERKAAWLQSQLNEVRRVLDRKQPGPEDQW